MRIVNTVVLAIGLGSGAAVAAQSGPANTGKSPGEQPSEQSPRITVSGCLQRSDTTTAAGSTTPTAGRPTSGAGSLFILTNASTIGSRMDGSTDSGRSGASGSATTTSGTATSEATSSAASGAATTASRGSGGAGTAGAASGSIVGRGSAANPGRTFTLVEIKAGELAPHIGHQMEITGLLGNATGTTASGTSGSSWRARPPATRSTSGCKSRR